MERTKMTKRGRSQPKVIFIEGIHGVGKSSVFHGLKRLYNPEEYKFYPERLLMKPLFPFGSQDVQIAFRSELHFLQQMIERNKLIETDLSKKKRTESIYSRSICDQCNCVLEIIRHKRKRSPSNNGSLPIS